MHSTCNCTRSYTFREFGIDSANPSTRIVRSNTPRSHAVCIGFKLQSFKFQSFKLQSFKIPTQPRILKGIDDAAPIVSTDEQHDIGWTEKRYDLRRDQHGSSERGLATCRPTMSARRVIVDISGSGLCSLLCARNPLRARHIIRRLSVADCPDR